MYIIGLNLSLPPWICQPWVRITPEEHLKKMKEVQNRIIQSEVEGLDKQVQI